jgi:transcriptional regulator with XRE-family HTH domain
MGGERQEVARVLGSNMHRLREDLGLSQGEVGVLAGLHSTAIGMFERGERSPGAHAIVKVAGALGVTPGELFEGIAWEPASPTRGRLRTSTEERP